jgi:hypothetical protein
MILLLRDKQGTFLFIYILFIFGTEVWTQGFVPVNLAFYHLRHTSSSYIFSKKDKIRFIK